MNASLLRPESHLRLGRLLALSLALAAAIVAFASTSAFATTGPYPTKWQEPADLKNHTVFAPTNLPAGPMPVLIWGEGGCIANGLVYADFLSEIASHGILVIASGGPFQLGVTNVGYMTNSLTWAKAQNAKVGGKYQGRLDVGRVAVAGHSCGGLEAYQLAAQRPEVAAVGIMNSGQLSVSQAQLDAINAPILYVLGGADDVAYSNGVRDFGALKPSIPAVLTQDASGHFGTYFSKDGGRYAQVLKDWIQWRIGGSTAASQTFVGACTLCGVSNWKVKTRNLG